MSAVNTGSQRSVVRDMINEILGCHEYRPTDCGNNIRWNLLTQEGVGDNTLLVSLYFIPRKDEASLEFSIRLKGKEFGELKKSVEKMSEIEAVTLSNLGAIREEGDGRTTTFKWKLAVPYEEIKKTVEEICRSLSNKS